MKCLSIRQPWAAWIVLGAKDVENRTWATRYRGPLLIHAGATPDRHPVISTACLDILTSTNARRNCREHENADTLGAIIGMAYLLDVAVVSSSPWWEGPPQLAWRLGKTRQLYPPIPYRGRLGLFEVPDQLVPKEWRGRG